MSVEMSALPADIIQISGLAAMAWENNSHVVTDKISDMAG